MLVTRPPLSDAFVTFVGKTGTRGDCGGVIGSSIGTTMEAGGARIERVFGSIGDWYSMAGTVIAAAAARLERMCRTT